MSANTKKKKPVPVEADPNASSKETYDWIQCLLVALIICVLIFMFCVRVIDVIGASMNPTLFNGEKMLVSGLFYKPKVGDVVVFKKDEYDPNKLLVKRVIAKSGDWVDIDEEGNVYVNQKLLNEPYLSSKALGETNIELPYQVPEDRIFVMGDNREVSVDSRNTAVGCVTGEQIVGKIIFRVWPFAGFGFVR